MLDAFNPATHAGELPSPCLSDCVMLPATGLCRGCRRNINEIIGWSSASQSQKRAIWLALKQRGDPTPKAG